jgi:hypothetical protein
MKRMNNVFFPIFFLLLVPISWIYVLPVNFAIDSLVLLLSMYVQKQTDIKGKWKISILKVWGLGFLSDIIGCLLLFPSLFFSGYSNWIGDVATKVIVNPFQNFLSLLLVMLAVAIAGYFIYMFNWKYSFAKTDMPEENKKKIALYLALFTAPYILLIPATYLYGTKF